MDHPLSSLVLNFLSTMIVGPRKL